MSFSAFSNFYQKLLFLLPFATEHFNYDEPGKWYLDFPQCLGYKQSPISISSHKAVDVALPPLLFGFYDVFFEDYVRLQNNGHTIKFGIPLTVEGVKPFITGGALLDVYQAEEVHFHWGSSRHKGSEHKLNGRRYDMEMHIVHRNTKYVSVEAAREYENGLVVLAVLFKVVKSPNVFYPGLNTIYNAVNYLRNFNATAKTSQLISLGSLLGDINREDFYTYQGSLTTPPCSEAVTWIVLSELLPISYVELPKFWHLRDARGLQLLNNFRPLQVSEYRKVFHRHATPQYDYWY